MIHKLSGDICSQVFNYVNEDDDDLSKLDDIFPEELEEYLIGCGFNSIDLNAENQKLHKYANNIQKNHAGKFDLVPDLSASNLVDLYFENRQLYDYIRNLKKYISQSYDLTNSRCCFCLTFTIPIRQQQWCGDCARNFCNDCYENQPGWFSDGAYKYCPECSKVSGYNNT